MQAKVRGGSPGTSGFVDDVMFSHIGANGPNKQTKQVVSEFGPLAKTQRQRLYILEFAR